MATALLMEEAESLMLVGHLPFLGKLAGLLLTNYPEPPFVEFSTASITELELGDKGWMLGWRYTPGFR